MKRHRKIWRLRLMRSLEGLWERVMDSTRGLRLHQIFHIKANLSTRDPSEPVPLCKMNRYKHISDIQGLCNDSPLFKGRKQLPGAKIYVKGQ